MARKSPLRKWKDRKDWASRFFWLSFACNVVTLGIFFLDRFGETIHTSQKFPIIPIWIILIFVGSTSLLFVWSWHCDSKLKSLEAARQSQRRTRRPQR